MSQEPEETTPDLDAIAARLDRLRHTHDEVLADLVMDQGLWVWLAPADDLPDWDHCPPTDRTLATWLCAGCPVIDQCLELARRAGGEMTTAVSGLLGEDNHRGRRPSDGRQRARVGAAAEGAVISVTNGSINSQIDVVLDEVRRFRDHAIAGVPSARRSVRMAELYQVEARLWSVLFERTHSRIYWRAALAAEAYARQCAISWRRQAETADSTPTRGAGLAGGVS